MDNHCQFVDGCPIFAYFNRTAKKVYLAMYCEGSYIRCQRRQLRLLGRPVPPDLLPYGGSLSYEVERRRPRTVL
jgi:hypothetical protein